MKQFKIIWFIRFFVFFISNCMLQIFDLNAQLVGDACIVPCIEERQNIERLKVDLQNLDIERKGAEKNVEKATYNLKGRSAMAFGSTDEALEALQSAKDILESINEAIIQKEFIKEQYEIKLAECEARGEDIGQCKKCVNGIIQARTGVEVSRCEECGDNGEVRPKPEGAPVTNCKECDGEGGVRNKPEGTEVGMCIECDAEGGVRDKAEGGEVIPCPGCEVKPCVECDGRGWYRPKPEGTEVSACKECDGSSNVRNKPEGTYVSDCEDCDGQGNVRPLEEGTYVSDCEDCDGKGNVRPLEEGTYVSDCEDCDGKGNVRPLPEGTYVSECEDCDGKGNIRPLPEGTYVSECEDCDGKGNVRPLPEGTYVSDCEDCDGQGNVRPLPEGTYVSDCEDCDGKGNVRPLEEGTYVSDCEDCDGQGNVRPLEEGAYVSDCEDCDGQGNVRPLEEGTYVSDCEECDGDGGVINTCENEKGNNGNGEGGDNGDYNYRSTYGAVSTSYSILNNKDAVFVSVYGGWMINHKWMIGLGGYKLVNNNKRFGINPKTNKQNVRMGYGGLMFEYRLFDSKLIHGTVNTLIGAGEISNGYLINDFRNQQVGSWEKKIKSSAFFVVQPSVNVDINLWKSFNIGVGGGYRYVTGNTLSGISNIKAPTVNLSLKFGVFKK